MRAGVTIIRAKDRVVYTAGCGYCHRDSLEMTAAGMVTVKAPHGEDVHPAAVTIQMLIREVRDPATLADLRRIINEQIEKAA
jgi:hypothetical protein